MSVLIKGMEMPKSCAYCPMLEGDRDDGLCHAASRWLDDEEYWLWYQYPDGDIDTSKPSNCPLVPVPPHGDLIDRDALIKDGWLNLHKEVMRMGGYAIHELPLKNPSIAVIIPAEEGET